MVGLLIATFIFLSYFLSSGEGVPVLASVAAAIPFLWYWHWIAGSIRGLIGVLFPVIGMAATVAGSRKEKAMGLGLLALSPVIIAAFLATPAMFIASVYCLDIGIDQSGEIVNQKFAVVGAVLYFIGILTQIVTRSQSGSGSGNK